MKTLYYTVEKELENTDGIEYANGYKNISLYKIEADQPKLITTIQAENEYNTLDELNHFVKTTITEEDDFGLNINETYLFKKL